jgi:hypothetical protein
MNELRSNLIAAAWAFTSETILIAVSPGIAVVLAFAAAIPVAIIHGTDDGLAYVVWLAVGVLSLPVIWLAGVIPIATTTRRMFQVRLLPPLAGALVPPAFLIALIATGNVDTAIEIIDTLRKLPDYAHVVR